MRSSMVAATLVAAGALLGACGGGGGGDGDGDGSSTPTFAISASAISFTAQQNDPAPAAQTVTVSAVSGTTFIGISQTAGVPFTSSFSLTTPTSGTITITPFAPFTPGVYTGVITVRGCSVAACVSGDVPGSPKTIAVTYTVTALPSLSATPTFLSFQAADGVAPAPQSVNLATTGAAGNWTSTIAYITGIPTGWLSLTPPNAGSLPASVSFQPGAVAAGTYTAEVTFTAGSLSTMVPVSLTVSPRGVNFVAPYVSTSNVPGDVVIRGHGFTGATSVSFGATSVNVTPVSDSEIRVTHPALALGTYPVTVGPQVLPTRAQLVVVGPPAYAPVAIARTGTPSHIVSLIYDAERRAVFLLDVDNDRIEGQRFNGAAWVADPPLSFSNGFSDNWRMTLAPDGTELLKTNGFTVSRVNPANLSLLSSESAVPALGSNPGLGFLTFVNDGTAIGVSTTAASGARLYGYDLLTRSFRALSTTSSVLNKHLFGPADASKVIFPSFQGGFNPPIFVYDASDGTFTGSSTTTDSVYQGSLSRNASRSILLQFPASITPPCTVYDANFAAIGTLPATSFSNAVLSPDGGIAYLYTNGTIRRFNLNLPDGSGGFLEIGAALALPASPGSNSPAMTISPDGGTLFLAGNQRLIIFPLP